MGISITVAGHGVDYAVRNPKGILYLLGDDKTDGSIRLIISANGKNSKIERREDGLFIPTGLELDADTVLRGTDRFLFNNNSELLIDNSGNQILKGGPVVPG